MFEIETLRNGQTTVTNIKLNVAVVVRYRAGDIAIVMLMMTLKKKTTTVGDYN